MSPAQLERLLEWCAPKLADGEFIPVLATFEGELSCSDRCVGSRALAKRRANRVAARMLDRVPFVVERRGSELRIFLTAQPMPDGGLESDPDCWQQPLLQRLRDQFLSEPLPISPRRGRRAPLAGRLLGAPA